MMNLVWEQLQPVADTGHFSSIYTGCFDTAGTLARILAPLRACCAGRLICLFGGRDGETPQDRQAIGAVAGRYADLVILTGDQLCREPSDAVGRAFADGLPAGGASREYIGDRTAAIQFLLDHCGRDDTTLLLRRCPSPDADPGSIPFLTDEQIAARYLATK